jgi:acyl-CoA dehydrogenase
MDFTFSEELEMMRKAVRNFVYKMVDPLADQIEKEDRIPDEIMQKAKEMGLFGLTMPIEYGGQDLDLVGKCAIYEELGKTINGFTTLIGAHNAIGSEGIVHFGTEEQKKKYIPKMASGEWIGAFALTEPNAGSDAANLQTTAKRQGDMYIVNGTKHFITNANIAHVFTVMAVTDKSKGAKGITSFIVEKDFPGLKIGKTEEKMGLHGSQSCEVIFEDCEVPVENVLGEEGQGYINALKILGNGRAALAARNLGSCEKLLELSMKYAEERVQFGKPIMEQQVIQHMLADMATEIEVLRSMTYRTAWMVDQGIMAYKESAMVKLYGSEVYGRVADKAVQIFGGMGYMREFPIERYYRDARIARIYEGTSEIQRNIIAKLLRKEYSA